jgi:probable phosphoglycerate mutase
MPETPPTTLFAVRHGETEWNRLGRQQGHLDTRLTDVGVRQARALAEGLVGQGIEAIYSSDLGRAMQTAQAIGERLGLPVTADAGLRERHLGTMQGLTQAEFGDRFPHEWAAFHSGDPDYVFPGGESARQRHARSVACAAELAKRHAGQHVLIVAHGGTLRSFFYHALCIPLTEPRRFSLFNAAINRFTVWEDRWRLETWGDVSHLEGTDTLDDN